MKRIFTTLSLLFAICVSQASLIETVGRADLSDWEGVKSIDCGVVTVDEGVTLSYTYPERKNYHHGFRSYFNGADWGEYKGISFEVLLPEEYPTTIELAFRVAPENAQALEPVSTASVTLQKEGWNRVFVAWENFSLRAGQRGTLQGVHNFTMKIGGDKGRVFEIRSVELLKAQTISLEAQIQGLATTAGGSVTYQLEVGNTTAQPQAVQLHKPVMGWEAMTTSISPSTFILQPYQTKVVEVEVSLPASLPYGTNEVQSLSALVNGAAVESIDLTTSVRVPSPYILHNAEAWAEVIQKAKDYDWAKKELKKYDEKASNWSVPTPMTGTPKQNPQCGPALFAPSQAGVMMDCAIAYRLTGKAEHAQKCVDFLRMLTNETSGYPVTMRAGQDNFVQEGGVFQDVARGYDMIYDSGLLTAEDHRLIEKTFRLFIKTVQMGNDDGGIGNWDLSELTGAFYCALMIGDFHLAKDIMYSPTGIYSQFAQGVMSDGWWYECSVGYNLWCASMFSEVGVALQPWGVNFLHELIPTGKVPHYSLQPNRMSAGMYGMDFKKWGRIEKNATTIKDMWDALVPMLDYRGVMFAVNDAVESTVIGEPFEKAYYIFRDPEYASVIKMGEGRNLLYGVPDLPDFKSVKNTQSAYADNMGIVQLRSQKEGREQREQIQAALHYGSHGGYHGHFDRTNFLSMMRYGRSFYNPEMIWYGYGNYNYKFLVQTSMTKNMVVVDQKMQQPVESFRTMFYTGDMVQATAVESNAKWSNPPYGGMRYDDKKDYTFRRKAWEEGRMLDFGDNEPEYNELTDFTEQITQRRLMLMMDDYVVLADYVAGEVEHTYDWLFHMKGFEGLSADKKEFIRHDKQLRFDPLSAAQMFTNCEWFSTQGTVESSYEMRFGKGSDNAGTRAPNSEDGSLRINVFNAWPLKTETTVATAPESHGVNKQVWYSVKGDGQVILSDSTGAWILGRRDISLDIAGKKELVLTTKLKSKAGKNTLFWGGAKVILKGGKEVDLSTLPIRSTNVMTPSGKGKDYYGGGVTIGGEPMLSSLAAEPADFKAEATITFDLSGLDAVKFESCIGGDFPLGDETQRRRTLNVRTQGKDAQFLAVIEPYESESMVASVKAKGADKLTVALKDGRTQEITIKNFDTDPNNIIVEVKEFNAKGKLLRQEIAK